MAYRDASQADSSFGEVLPSSKTMLPPSTIALLLDTEFPL